MTSAALSPGYRAARERVALIHRDRGLILVSGRDRASYLQGLLTNDITALTAGQGCYTAYLTAQGRMITDLFVYELGDVLLLATPASTRNTVLAKLDQFIFSEDVQLGDVTDSVEAVAVVGPDAVRVVARVIGAADEALVGLAEHGCLRQEAGGQPVIVLRVTDTGEPGLELVAPREQMVSLVTALEAAGAVSIDEATADVLRIEAGVPRYGADMDDETIPLEAGIEGRAISFNKGCYVGQEVIIRVLHRGHGRVARRLVGLVAEPGQTVPPPGTVLLVDGTPVGAVTSSASSPSLGRPIALGYVKRDFVEPGTHIATADYGMLDVAALPFLPR